MRHIVLLFIYTLAFQILISQTISRSILLENGTTVKPGYVFNIGDNPSFKLENANEPCDWDFIILGKNDKQIKISKSNAVDFHLKFDGIPMEYWQDAKRFSDGDKTLFAGFIMTTLKTPEGISGDYIPFEMNLLPSCPKIINGDLSGEYDCEWDIYDATLRLDVYCSQVDGFMLRFTEENLFTLPDKPEYPYGIGFLDLTNRKIGESLYQLDALVGWGTYFYIIARNRFGSISTNFEEQNCTTNYITDEKVKKRIEELRNEASGISYVENDEITIAFKDNILTFMVGDDITEVEVYDVYGNLRCSQYDGAPIDCSGYPKGIYIVRYIVNSRQSFTSKFIKP